MADASGGISEIIPDAGRTSGTHRERSPMCGSSKKSPSRLSSPAAETRRLPACGHCAGDTGRPALVRADGVPGRVGADRRPRHLLVLGIPDAATGLGEYRLPTRVHVARPYVGEPEVGAALWKRDRGQQRDLRSVVGMEPILVSIATSGMPLTVTDGNLRLSTSTRGSASMAFGRSCACISYYPVPMGNCHRQVVHVHPRLSPGKTVYGGQ
jgi:hypothetical protein